MELKDIAVISGKGGLYKILKPTRTGVIVESIDDKKSRFAVSTSNRISVLEEISLYTKTTDGSTPLKQIFRKIYSEFKEDPGVQSSSSPEELKAFFHHIEPEYDEEKVYLSDMKKIVSWYYVILNNFPDLLTKEEEEVKEENKQESGKAEVKNESKTKKPVKHADNQNLKGKSTGAKNVVSGAASKKGPRAKSK